MRCAVGLIVERTEPKPFIIIRRVRHNYRGFRMHYGRSYHIEDIAMNNVDVYCANCLKRRSTHVNCQCLFSARKFRPFEIRINKTHAGTKKDSTTYDMMTPRGDKQLRFLANQTKDFQP